MLYAIGTKGETTVKVIVKDKKIRSAYPVPGANFGTKFGGFIGVPAVGSIINFFNPLSDIQDVINEFSGQSCEIN